MAKKTAGGEQPTPASRDPAAESGGAAALGSGGKRGDQSATPDQVFGDHVSGSKIGTQVNTEGAAVFLRAVEAQTIVGRDQITQYIGYGSLPIVWPKESEKRYLTRLQEALDASLRVRRAPGKAAGSRDSEFVEPLLSCRRMATSPSDGGEQRIQETTQGTWSELVTRYPVVGVLVGDSHSGRSLLLQWIVASLARDTVPGDGSVLPIYLSVSRFPFTDAHGLLDTAAFACGQQPESMHDCWYQGTRRVFLAIDDADQIPQHQRAAFLLALQQLQASRGLGHSILVACRPESGPNSFQSQLTPAFATEPGWVQWIILPLDEGRIHRLLAAYGAESWLKSLIEKNERLRWLVRYPGTLSDLVRATRGLHLVSPPNNLAQLYQLFVDGYLFGGGAPEADGAPTQAQRRYHYGRVKQRLLAYLAFRMLAGSRPNGIEIDDALCRELAQQLERLATGFTRTRRYMPEDWNVSDALQELFQSPVVNRDAARADQFEFASATYRDYYAAVYLHTIGSGWREAAEVIKKCDLHDWTDALILLSGLPPNESVNELLNAVLAGESSLAADMWLEKGAVGFSKVPECVVRAFDERRIEVPERLDFPVHPAIAHFGRIVRDARPEVALQAVNGLMQLGIDAIDPLLDAVETGHPLVVASAVHALFQMGPCLARARSAGRGAASERHGGAGIRPLLTVRDHGLVFDNLGACNARLGDLTLVSVPRTLQAELVASFGRIDFDPFQVPSSFELWHTPVAWFAIDYFRALGEVDWIGLAAACDSVVRCAGLIVGKALRRGAGMGPIVEEMSQCAIAYDRLGRWIASDLEMGWRFGEPPQAPPEIADASEQIYKELRLFFNRANRQRMLGGTGDPARAGMDRRVAVNQVLQSCTGTVLGIDVSEVAAPSDVADLPSRHQVAYEQRVDRISQGGLLRGIHVSHIAGARFRAAEVYSLHGRLDIGSCEAAGIEGIAIDSLTGWNGLRVRLELSVGNLERAQVTGIIATAPHEVFRPSPEPEAPPPVSG